MISPQEQYDIIDNYLNDRMSEKERMDFEKNMAQDETLTTKVNEAREANEAIYYASLAELKLTIGKDIKNIKYKPAFNWKKAAYISIPTALLISSLTASLLINNENSEPTKAGPEIIIKTPPQENKNMTIGGSSNVKKLAKAPILNNKTHDPVISDNKPSLETSKSDILVQKNIEESKNTNQENKVLSIGNDNSIKNPEPTSISEPKIVCDKNFNITTEATCKHQETGSIIILTDNSKEYKFQVNNHSSSGTKGVFQDLASGEYEVIVTYSKGCSYTKSVNISEKWCPLNSAYSFNPDYNEKWMIKYEHGSSGRFTIFDIRGKEIYSSAFGSGNEQWNGTDIYGSVVGMGVYIAIINYSNGREERVELTIVR